ncbi:alpha-glucan family phosphorylase [Phycisphaeraceae bacterium D3-23]
MSTPEFASIERFDVEPRLPESLEGLRMIANNLWWSWQSDAVDLFIQLDPTLWRSTRHCPSAMLKLVDQHRLDELANDTVYRAAIDAVVKNLEQHKWQPGWMQRNNHTGDDSAGTIAYFCAEFALTESLRIYSGGLGVLAGDHLKSASDLGLPLIAVGLLYRHGYFQQYLTADGWQMEDRPRQDFDKLPVTPVTHDNGEPVRVTVRLPKRDVTVALWKAEVGRVPLYLLDTDLPENESADREITAQLYGGDMDMRIRQEVVLGIGGVRALEAIGIRPEVCHMNEGHSAFLALERIRRLIEEHNLPFDEARQAAMASHVFTTHTPVPAGIDRFPAELVRSYMAEYHDSLRLDMEGLLALGRDDVFNKDEPFSMATLAIRTSDWCNGVSALHGEVSRTMWQRIWPGVPAQEVPIGHVTNGVHTGTWLARPIAQALDAQGQTDETLSAQSEEKRFAGIHDVADEALWSIHEDRRRKLIDYTKRDDPTRPARLGPVRHADNDLDPNALTIGFARRFATYKRGDLFLRDADRLVRLLRDTDRPIQFVIAGKAHPADGGGKAIIQQLVRFTHEHGLAGRIVFLENYNMHVARYLVQGCDVWLNNPRRGMEASGTSGMKAALNGVLNCSILDGWWDEAYTPEVGWAIGYREDQPNPDTADDIESRSLYALLENTIIPMFYDRDAQGVPRRWVAMMKDCIAKLGRDYNTSRMVGQYAQQFYLPAMRRQHALMADGLEKSVARSAQKDKLRAAWPSVKFVSVNTQGDVPIQQGQPMHIEAAVALAGLAPEDVRVQALVGPLDDAGVIQDARCIDLSYTDGDQGNARYLLDLATDRCGGFGVALRVVPGGELLQGVTEPGLIRWHGEPVVEPKPKRVLEPAL